LKFDVIADAVSGMLIGGMAKPPKMIKAEGGRSIATLTAGIRFTESQGFKNGVYSPIKCPQYPTVFQLRDWLLGKSCSAFSTLMIGSFQR